MVKPYSLLEGKLVTYQESELEKEVVPSRVRTRKLQRSGASKTYNAKMTAVGSTRCSKKRTDVRNVHDVHNDLDKGNGDVLSILAPSVIADCLPAPVRNSCSCAAVVDEQQSADCAVTMAKTSSPLPDIVSHVLLPSANQRAADACDVRTMPDLILHLPAERGQLMAAEPRQRSNRQPRGQSSFRLACLNKVHMTYQL
jgi:hypothetical protein